MPLRADGSAADILFGYQGALETSGMLHAALQDDGNSQNHRLLSEVCDKSVLQYDAASMEPFILIKPFIDDRLVGIKFRAECFRILCFRFRCVKIGHVEIFDDGLTVMSGFDNNFRDCFPLLIIELSDKMDLVHC